MSTAEHIFSSIRTTELFRLRAVGELRPDEDERLPLPRSLLSVVGVCGVCGVTSGERGYTVCEYDCDGDESVDGDVR